MNRTANKIRPHANKITRVTVIAAITLVGCSVAWGQQQPWTANGSNITNTNAGNVGVGTPTPGKLLTVNGDAGVTTLYGNSTSQNANDSLKLGPGANGNFFIDNIGAGTFAQTIFGYNQTKTNAANSVFSVFNNSTDRLQLFFAQSAGTASGTNQVSFPTGNVGIGTTNPAFKLHIVTGADVYNAFRIVAPDNHFAHISPSLGAGSFNPITQAGDTAIIFGNGISTPGSASLVIAPWSGTLSGLRMDTNGNVGIGTATPWEKLAVMEGNVSLYGSTPWTSGNLRLTAAGSSASWRLAPCNNVGDVNCPPNGLVIHQDVVGTRMAFTSNGNVGIGTMAPNYKLDVAGTAGLGQAYLTNSDVYFNNPSHNHTGFGNVAGNAAIENAANYNTLMILGRSGGIGGVRSVSIYDRLDVNGALNATGSVGIGTTGPGYKLDVQGGQVNASGGFCIAGDCKTSWSQLGGASQWSTAGTSAYFNSGNVGIGTASPDYTLDVNGGFLHTTFNTQSLPTSSGLGGLAVGWNRTGGYAEVNFYNVYNNAHTAFQFSQKTGTGTATDLLTIMGDGKVGIGTTTPSAALDVAGNINVSGNINAKYQDVAEWVPAAQPLVAGTVVVLDPESSNHVIASTREYDTTVAGVISEKPGISLGQAGEGRILVATTGRVMVQVDASHGPIRVGDLLVTSGNTGMAMRSEPLDLGGAKIHRPGTLIGKALEPLNSGTGKILVLLSLQ